MSVITLTTDFGDGSPYVAVMKGVILSINPSAHIVDLSHVIRPQDIRHGSYMLSTAVPYFPAGTIHVAVVDPGVGTERKALLASAANQFIVAPDNGLLTGLLDHLAPASVWELNESAYWRPTVSSTFHGRDIFAPVAAHLSLNVAPSRLGTAIDSWVRLPGHSFHVDGSRLTGSIQFVDHFGNLISNIPAEAIVAGPREIRLDGRLIEGFRWVRTYGEADPGQIVGLISSDGFLEIAVVNGNAAARLEARAGDPIGAVT
jgi:S-adenosyl-L-methionine hydrolase (adenosine-forming)